MLDFGWSRGGGGRFGRRFVRAAILALSARGLLVGRRSDSAILGSAAAGTGDQAVAGPRFVTRGVGSPRLFFVVSGIEVP